MPEFSAAQVAGMLINDTAWNGGHEKQIHSESPSTPDWSKSIAKLICGLMLPFNVVSIKLFIKFIAAANLHYCVLVHSSWK